MSTSPPLTDLELYDRLRGGQATALNELFRRFYVGLCRTAVRFVTEEAAAEDVVQDFFAHLWDRRETLPEVTGTVEGYLRRAVRNRSLNYLRDRKRIPVDDGELPPDRPSSAQLPGEALEQDELRHRLYRAIDSLPERCRLVFVMSKIEQMSQREIADSLDISPKTVENQMTRAYRFLRQVLGMLLLLSGSF